MPMSGESVDVQALAVEAAKEAQDWDSLNDQARAITRVFAPPFRAMQEEIERLKPQTATHRCKECGALWRLWAAGEVHPDDDGSWMLISPSCGKCCDNVAMGDQIQPLGVLAAIEEELADLQATHNTNLRTLAGLRAEHARVMEVLAQQQVARSRQEVRLQAAEARAKEAEAERDVLRASACNLAEEAGRSTALATIRKTLEWAAEQCNWKPDRARIEARLAELSSPTPEPPQGTPAEPKP
jgi:hypothetical protein